ncbi:hypothetical protein QIT00_15430 [Streptomyces sp. B-S-A12]|uniref:Uncharacterized protein n=1 Tax=Streptomyces luteolus TaxID=3043615 RepID=A0ABT6SWG8_9ACTN|nr:hypothetical protein [Streptomyces sp. B-S-A12]MDI3419940.1 hypothetical protein [Streptomyces sp. B-S-A12]
MQPLRRMHVERAAERLGRLAAPVRRVEAAHSAADPLERVVEVLEVCGRLLDRRRVPVHQLLRGVGRTEAVLLDVRAEVGGDAVSPALDLVRRAFGAHVVQAVGNHVGA